MQGLESLSENVCQDDQHDAARDQYERKPPVQRDYHHKRRDEPDDRADKTRQYLNIGIRNDHSIIGQPVHPFARMHSAYIRILPAEYIVSQAFLEQVLDVGSRKFSKPSQDRPDTDIQHNKGDNETCVDEEGMPVVRHRAVDGITQQERIKHPDAAADALDDSEHSHVPVPVSYYIYDPAYGFVHPRLIFWLLPTYFSCRYDFSRTP